MDNWNEVIPDYRGCVLCGKKVGSHGKYNHSMVHVREGLAEREVNHLYPRAPYKFKLNEAGTAVAILRGAIS